MFVHRRTRRREQVLCASSAEFGTRLLSDQLSDYGVDDPYIQAHLHRPGSRSVLPLDDSPTLLRDEEVAGSNPVTPTLEGLVRYIFGFWTGAIGGLQIQQQSTAAISVQGISKSPQRLARGGRAGIGVDLHGDCLVCMPKDSHDHARMYI